jgi:hypothetical protein
VVVALVYLGILEEQAVVEDLDGKIQFQSHREVDIV